MSREFEIDKPEVFTVGTIGPVGHRAFFLQCVASGETLTFKVEKFQVALMADYLARIVRLSRRPGHLPDLSDIQFGVDLAVDWVVGSIEVSFDEDRELLVLLLSEAPDESALGWQARITLTREQAGAFAIRATQLVESGRPPCPLCSQPLDPAGHDCPRTNGHRPPIT